MLWMNNSVVTSVWRNNAVFNQTRIKINSREKKNLKLQIPRRILNRIFIRNARRLAKYGR